MNSLASAQGENSGPPIYCSVLYHSVCLCRRADDSNGLRRCRSSKSALNAVAVLLMDVENEIQSKSELQFDGAAEGNKW